MEKKPTPERALRGFEHVKRYWDKEHNCITAKILPGEYYVTKRNECVTTVLGSCISACIRDVRMGVGGMNHFMLPAPSQLGASVVSDAARYGNFAMEHLINSILSNGGSRKNLEFKLFGGGKMLATMTDVGKKNIEFILEYMQVEGFRIVSQDLGDIYPRKIIYFPETGKAKMKRITSLHNDTIMKREKDYAIKIKSEPVQGDVELF